MRISFFISAIREIRDFSGRFPQPQSPFAQQAQKIHEMGLRARRNSAAISF